MSDLITTTTMIFAVIVVPTWIRGQGNGAVVRVITAIPVTAVTGGAFTSNTESNGTVSGTALGAFWLGLNVGFPLGKMKKYLGKE